MAIIQVDMTNVKDGFALVSEGDKICKVAKIELKDGEKGKYLGWEFVIGIGPEKGQKIFHNTSLVPKALFNLRNVLTACQVEVPASIMKVDTDKVIGKIVGITVGHETYTDKSTKKEKTKAAPAEFFSVAKGAAGWARVNPAKEAVAKVTEPEPEEDEIDTSTAMVVDDVEEIEI